MRAPVRRVLDDLGVAGRHVGVLLDNVPEYVFLLGGAALSGRVVVGINPTRRGEELARDIRHTDCAVVLTDAAHADAARGARPRGAGAPRRRPRLDELARRRTARTPLPDAAARRPTRSTC